MENDQRHIECVVQAETANLVKEQNCNHSIDDTVESKEEKYE